MAGIGASVIDQNGNKQVLVTNKSGNTEVYSADEAKSLEQALSAARLSIDNEGAAKRAQDEEQKRQEEGAAQRLKEIKEANSKSDAEAAERKKKDQEAHEAAKSAGQKMADFRGSEPTAAKEEDEHESVRRRAAHK